MIKSDRAPAVDEDDEVIQQMERRLGIKGNGKGHRGGDKVVLGEDLDFLLRYKEDAEPDLAAAGLTALDELEGMDEEDDSDMEHSLEYDDDVLSDEYLEEDLSDDSDDEEDVQDPDFAALNQSLSLPVDSVTTEPDAIEDAVRIVPSV